MNICSTYLKLKKCLTYECNLQHFTRNIVGSRTCKYKGQKNDHLLHHEQVFGNGFERRESKCCALLMKHRLKVKGDQMITLQMAQQLKTKNVSVAPGQLVQLRQAIEYINKNFATCKSICNLRELYTTFKEKHPKKYWVLKVLCFETPNGVFWLAVFVFVALIKILYCQSMQWTVN